jgi:cation diffusion facilitator CzcD-associated flavoprotein CzcO
MTSTSVSGDPTAFSRIPTLDWLIVGGGPHGCHLAGMLRQRRRPAPGTMRILDRYPKALHVWDTLAGRVGMDFLRSPSVHHLDAEPMALQRFAYDSDMPERARFLGPYNRPALSLFRAHTGQVVERSGLEQIWLRGEALAIQRDAKVWKVTASEGPLRSRRLVLAPGMSRQPAWPDWALAARDGGAAISHLFDEEFQTPSPAKALLIIGGGITAAQFALAAIQRGQRQVTLLSHHPLRTHTFDADPGWMGPKYLDAFHAEPDWRRRRDMIVSARQRGTMPEETLEALHHARTNGRLRIEYGQPQSLQAADSGDGLRLDLREGGHQIADEVVLCTGFAPVRPGGPMLDQLIAEQGLPVAPCGYPVLPKTLEWAPGLFVMGPLAELEVGPVARNIAGARMGAARILAATSQQTASNKRPLRNHRVIAVKNRSAHASS